MVSDLAEEWYATLGPDLSQGDIIRRIPWGLIDDPLTVCQPNNTDATGKSKYYPIDSVPKWRGLQFLHAKFDLNLGIVLWPDCQIDKQKTNVGLNESGSPALHRSYQ